MRSALALILGLAVWACPTFADVPGHTYPDPLDYEPFGVVGTVGTEETYESIKNLTHFMAVPNDMETYYVSDDPGGDLPQGDDTWPGTREMPLRTIYAANLLMDGRNRVRIVLDAQDTWNDPGRCVGATDPISVCDAGTGICPNCYFRGLDGAGLNTSNCTAGELCMLVTTTDPTGTHKPVLQGNGAVATGQQGTMFGNGPSVTAGAIIAMENVVFEDAKGWDGHGGSDGVIAVLLGVDFTTSLSSAGSFGHGGGVKEGGALISINSNYRIEDDGTAANGVAGIFYGTSNATAVDNRISSIHDQFVYNDDDLGNGTSIFRFNSVTASVIGAHAVVQSVDTGPTYSQNSPTMIAMAPAGGDTQGTTVTVARSYFGKTPVTAASYSVFLRPQPGAAMDSSVTIYESTVHRIPIFWWGNAINDTGTASVTARGLLWDDCAAAGGATCSALYSTTDAKQEGTTIDIALSAFDDAEGSSNWGRYYNGSTNSTATSCSGLLTRVTDSAQATVTNFWSELSSGGTNCSSDMDTNGNPFTDGTTDLIAQAACQNGGSSGCRGGYTDTYTVTLAEPIPAFVLGTKVTKFTLTGKNIGAR